MTKVGQAMRIKVSYEFRWWFPLALRGHTAFLILMMVFGLSLPRAEEMQSKFINRVGSRALVISINGA